ncbi:MAG: hypothetical protein ACMXYG_03425 [Candidatus Woesearchaeota archaeon]
MKKYTLFILIFLIIISLTIIYNKSNDNSIYESYDYFYADIGFEGIADKMYDYFINYTKLVIENTTLDLEHYKGKIVLLNYSYAIIGDKRFSQREIYQDLIFLEHLNKQGLYILTYGPNMYFAKFNDHNLRQFTETKEGLWDKSYSQYCKEMDNILRIQFYSRLIDITINGFYQGWKYDLTYQESILLVDTIGIALAEEYKARKVKKPSYEMFSGYNNIILAMLILYMNNGGEMENGGNSCIDYQTNYIQNRDKRIHNELILTELYKKEYLNDFNNLVIQINGEGENIFDDIINFIKTPIDYDSEKKQAINHFLEFLRD